VSWIGAENYRTYHKPYSGFEVSKRLDLRLISQLANQKLLKRKSWCSQCRDLGFKSNYIELGGFCKYFVLQSVCWASSSESFRLLWVFLCVKISFFWVWVVWLA